MGCSKLATNRFVTKLCHSPIMDSYIILPYTIKLPVCHGSCHHLKIISSKTLYLHMWRVKIKKWYFNSSLFYSSNCQIATVAFHKEKSYCSSSLNKKIVPISAWGRAPISAWVELDLGFVIWLDFGWFLVGFTQGRPWDLWSLEWCKKKKRHSIFKKKKKNYYWKITLHTIFATKLLIKLQYFLTNLVQ